MMAYNVSQVMQQAGKPALPVPSLVAQFRLAHLGELIWRGRDQMAQRLYRSIRQLYDSTGPPSWEIMETLFQNVFEPNYQT